LDIVKNKEHLTYHCLPSKGRDLALPPLKRQGLSTPLP